MVAGVVMSRRSKQSPSTVNGSIDLLGPIAWHSAAWASDPLWTPPSDGSVVTSWRGVNSRDWTQNVSGLYPIYRASTTALGNKPSVEFDGVDDFLQTPTFSTVSAPFSLVALVQRLGAGGGGNERIVNTTDPALLMNYPVAGKWGVYAGGAVATPGAYDTNGHLLVGVVASGSAGFIALDGVKTTGTTGTSGFTYLQMAKGAAPSDYGKVKLAFVGVFVGDVTADAAWPQWKSDAAQFYGLTIL